MKGEPNVQLDEDETIPLNSTEPKKTWFQTFVQEQGLLLFYVVMCVIVGAANRVTFRLMQYSMMNYSYFISQVTTFIYLPVNFGIVLVKLLFTDHITPEMLNFPKWKFVVMGLFDSLQGLLIVVGGLHVSGIMQNLLLQGAVPVTMLFSLLMLRSMGDNTSRVARQTLQDKKINFQEEYAGDDVIEAANGQSVCRLTVNGRDMGNIPKILEHETPPDPDAIARMINWVSSKLCKKNTPAELEQAGSIQGSDLGSVTLLGGASPEELVGKKVVLITDAHSWTRHLKSFYSIPQYFGALVIMGGLVISVYPQLIKTDSSGDSVLFELIFFAATIPTAVSGVYKEIAFKSVEDMDVWYLNGYVAIYQFLIGLTYAPLAAVMTNLDISAIPANLWQGTQCWLLGTNFISRENGFECSTDLNCGTGDIPCCDSCDGSIPTISSIPALYALPMYMVANIAYNIFIVLVIKHGSAALMYATSTIVLPLGAAMFTIRLFLGDHAQDFDIYSGIGLGVILLGLVIYRFVDLLYRKWMASKKTL